MIEIFTNFLFDLACGKKEKEDFDVKGFGQLVIWFVEAIHQDLFLQKWVHIRGGMVEYQYTSYSFNHIHILHNNLTIVS